MPMLTEAQKHFKSHKWTLQQDGASSHTTKRMMQEQFEMLH